MPEPTPRSIRFLRVERTSEPIRKQLAAIDQIRGVQGWMIGSDIGEVLFTSMHSTFNLRMLDTIGSHVVQSSTAAPKSESVSELEINFTQGNVIGQKIGKGWLMAFCGPQTDLAMARMTLSVTAAALSADKSFQNALASPVQSVMPDTTRV